MERTDKWILMNALAMLPHWVWGGRVVEWHGNFEVRWAERWSSLCNKITTKRQREGQSARGTPDIAYVARTRVDKWTIRLTWNFGLFLQQFWVVAQSQEVTTLWRHSATRPALDEPEISKAVLTIAGGTLTSSTVGLYTHLSSPPPNLLPLLAHALLPPSTLLHPPAPAPPESVNVKTLHNYGIYIYWGIVKRVSCWSDWPNGWL